MERIEKEVIMRKKCRYCFEEKELEEFVRCKYNKNGRQNMCYECKRKKNKLRNLEKVHDNYFFGGNRDKVLERDGYKCVECGMTRDAHKERYGRDIEIDHIDGMGRNVLKEFKNNDINNLRTLCLSCHKAHHNKVRCLEEKPTKPDELENRLFEADDGEYKSLAHEARRWMSEFLTDQWVGRTWHRDILNQLLEGLKS